MLAALDDTNSYYFGKHTEVPIADDQWLERWISYLLHRKEFHSRMNSVNEFLLSHVVEHIHNILPMMQELYRIAQPESKYDHRVPYGSSDDAYEDPTHIRQYFIGISDITPTVLLAGRLWILMI